MKKDELSLFETNQDLNDKLNNLYRLAEFGRLSAGAFHDLMSPLTIVSLNLEQLNKFEIIKNNHDFSQIKNSLTQAILATKKMEDLILCLKHYLNKNNTKIFFGLAPEINSAIKILNYQTIKNNIKIAFQNNLPHEQCYGDPVKFNQIIYNLLSNAVESYTKQKTSREKRILISLDEQEDKIIVKVSDWGPGIKEELMEKIFLPFFSTKKSCGLGLYISKRLTEKDFLGSLKIKSRINKKTVFSLTFPRTSQKELFIE